MKKIDVKPAVWRALLDRNYYTVSLFYELYPTESASIIERINDYIRLQCPHQFIFNELKELLIDLKAPAFEEWVDVMFYRAVIENDIEKIRTLHKRGADVHAWNDVAVRFAFEVQDYDLAKELISMGADVSANSGQTLKAAVKCEKVELITLIADTLMHKRVCEKFLTESM